MRYLRCFLRIKSNIFGTVFLAQAALGLPPLHSQITEFATRIIRNGENTRPLGKHWIDGFLQRNAEVKFLKSKPIDYQRVSGANIETIRSFYPYLNLPMIKKIKPRYRYNIDETGVMEGLGLTGLVLGSSELRYAIRKQFSSRVWTSIIECISATGEVLRPLVIFKGQSVQ